MKYFALFSTWPVEYWVALFFGAVVVFLYSINEFPKPTFSPVPRWPENPFSLADLTTRRDYLVSYVLYTAGLELTFVAICIIGPAPFVELNIPADDQHASAVAPVFESWASVPLWAALFLIGAMPRLPFLQVMEQQWRRLLQQRAAIPGAAVQLSNRMRRAKQDFRRLEESIARRREPYASYVTSEDIEGDRDTTPHYWARLSAILLEIEELEFPSDNTIDRWIDTAFILAHKSDIDVVRNQYRQIAVNLQSIRQISRDDNPTLLAAFYAKQKSDIDAAVERSCIILSCAIIAKRHRFEDQTNALTELGFRGHETTQNGEYPESSRNADIIAQGFFLTCGLIFLTRLAAPLLDDILPPSMVKAGWPKEVDTKLAAFWMLSWVLVHGPALITGLALRRHLSRRDKWYGGTMEAPTDPRFLKYLLVTLGSVIPALVLYPAFVLAIRGVENTWSFYQLTAPTALVGGCTAFFVIRMLDISALGLKAGNLLPLVLLQVLFTAIVQAVTAYHYLSYTKDAGPDGDGIGGAVVFGVSLAFIFALSLGLWIAHAKGRWSTETSSQ